MNKKNDTLKLKMERKKQNEKEEKVRWRFSVRKA